MTDTSDNIKISSRFILYTISIIIGIVIFLFVFENINNKRKKEKFYELIEVTSKSYHISNLISYTKKFNETDSLKIKIIKEELINLNKEIKILYSCKLIIPNGEFYQIINGYKNSKLLARSRLTKKEKKAIDLINNNLIEEIYNLNKNDQPIWSIIKIENNYLIIRRYIYD